MLIAALRKGIFVLCRLVIVVKTAGLACGAGKASFGGAIRRICSLLFATLFFTVGVLASESFAAGIVGPLFVAHAFGAFFIGAFGIGFYASAFGAERLIIAIKNYVFSQLAFKCSVKKLHFD